MHPTGTVPATTFRMDLQELTVFVIDKYGEVRDMNAGGAPIECAAQLAEFVRELFAQKMLGVVPSELHVLRHALEAIEAPSKSAVPLLGTVQLALEGDAQAIIACANWAHGYLTVDEVAS